jgi:hypothetical protein
VLPRSPRGVKCVAATPCAQLRQVAAGVLFSVADAL